MVAEACLIYGWMPDHVLKMNARMFFALFRSGKKISDKKKAQEYVSLCDIAAISFQDPKYLSEIRMHFYNMSVDEDHRLGKKVWKPEDPLTIMQIDAIFKEAERLNQ